MLLRSSAWIPVALAALTACQGTDSRAKVQLDSATTALSKLSDTLHVGQPVAHRYGAATGKIRIAHLMEVDGKPYGPLDLYDVPHPDSATQPLITGLAYGQMSDYISPRGSGPGFPSNLYLFPAGQRQASSPFGDHIDNSGYAATDQLTVALTPTKPGLGFGAATIVEEGRRQPASLSDTEHVAPPGQAVFIVRQVNTNVDSLPELFLMVDGTCPQVSNSFHPVGADLLYHVSAGTHTLGVVTSPRGHGIHTCAGLTPGATSTVNAAAGRRYAVLLYGLPSDGFKVIAAPIATP